MVKVQEEKNGIYMELVTDRDSYNYIDTARCQVWIENRNRSLEGAEVTVEVKYTNERDSKTFEIPLKVGGYGLQVSSSVFDIPVYGDTEICAEIKDMVEIYPLPHVSIEKIVWDGVTVWEGGKQLAYPVVPIKDGIRREALRFDFDEFYKYSIPQVYIKVSKAVYGQYAEIWFENCGYRPNGTRCYGESGASLKLEIGKTHVLTSQHVNYTSDLCYNRAARYVVNELYGVLDRSRTYSVIEEHVGISTGDFSFTLKDSYDGLFMSICTFDCYAIYRNGSKVASGCGGTYPCRQYMLYNLKSGDEIRIKKTTTKYDGRWFGLFAAGVKVILDPSIYGTHRVYLRNKDVDQVFEIRFKVYAVPEKSADKLVNMLKSAGLNAFKLKPTGVLYK